MFNLATAMTPQRKELDFRLLLGFSVLVLDEKSP